MQAPRTFGSSVKHYVAGLLAAAWNGAIGAVSGIAGVAAVNMTGALADVHLLNWKEMLSVFAGAFCINGIMWLKAHPLPESFDTEAPFTINPKPPAP